MDLRAELEAVLAGTYVFERELGGGGMSRVFVAEERALGRKVVVKVLPPELAATVSIERFNREIRTTAVLQHAHIVPVYSTGEVSGLPYYTMPFVGGESLRARLDASTPFPLAEAIGVLRDVVKALAYAHERGVVHRDIKPGNVLLSGGSAVVTDFGLAKALSDARGDEATRAAISQAGAPIGTPAYMAPEQLSGSRNVDHRADIYAFGVVAYEVLAGRLPSRGPADAEPLARARPTMPPRLAALVMKCIEASPDARPRSAAVIVRVLDALAPRSSGAIRWVRSVGFAPRVRWVWAMAGVTIIAIVIGAIVRSSQRSVAGMPTSIAVLPPVTAGADTADAYFSDGIADELTTALGKLPGLRVIPRASTVSVGATGRSNFRDLGKQLGVESLLSLRVSRNSGHLRIHTLLTSTKDGHLIFADDKDGDARNVFSVQDTIAKAIIATLRVRLAGGPAVLIVSPTTHDLEAYDLYLRGRYFSAADDQRKAIEYFTRAIGRDSAYAVAHAGLADAYYLLAAHGFEKPADALPLAKAAAARALRLDDAVGEAHVSLANVARWWDYDRPTAEREFRRALELNPRYAEAHLSYGWFLMDRGSVDSALAEARAAVALDPLSQRTRSDLGHLLLLAGHTDSAIAHFRRLAEFDSANRTVAMLLGRALLVSGQMAEGTTQMLRARLVDIRLEVELARWMGTGYTRDRARHALARLDAVARTNYVPAQAFAVLHLRAGNHAEALSWVERGYRERSLPPELKMLPEFVPLHAEPRFQQILRAMGVER